MAEGDFSWLWRNEELSDFTLIIREALPTHFVALQEQPATAEAPALASVQPTTGVQTRASKRKAAANDAGTSHSSRKARRQTASANEPAAEEQQQQQQQEQLQPDRQLIIDHIISRLPRTRAAIEQIVRTRIEEYSAQLLRETPLTQEQQQRLLPRLSQQPPQQPEHAVHDDLTHTVAGRRTRRTAAGSAAADEGHDARQGDAAAGPSSIPPASAAAAAAGSSSSSQRVLRRSSRLNRHSSEDAAAAAAAEVDAAALRSSRAMPSAVAQIYEQQSAAAGTSSRAISTVCQQQQQHAAAAAGAGPSTQQQQQHGVEIRIPVHAVVLAGFSEYFKALICSWAGSLDHTLTLDVAVGEAAAAEKMVEFMYTGKLPADAPAEELLKMIRLADQYQVTRFLAAASSTFESLPLSSFGLSVVLEVFALPQLMLDAPEMSRVVTKARAKLLDLYGDLEKVWSSDALRDQFLSLPLPAVQCLLASEATAVAAENTALVALTTWIEQSPAGRATTALQRKELLHLIRLPYLSSAFIGDVIYSINWARDCMDVKQLLNALQFAVASECTRQRLAASESLGPPSATPHFRCPRPLSSVSRASFEWSIELSTIKRMVADAKLWGRVVELSSPAHHYAGFWWQLLFNVEKSPLPAEAAAGQQPDAAAAAAPVIEFVGVRCHVNCGSAQDMWPHVVRFKASIAALQNGFWDVDFAYVKAIEGSIVDGVGLGYPGFFALPGQAIESDAAWSRFVRGGRIHLRCEVLDCE